MSSYPISLVPLSELSSGQGGIARHFLLLANFIHNADAYSNIGNAYFAMGRHPEAISNFEKAISLDPQSAGAYYNLGAAHFSLGDVQETSRAFARVLELDPSHPQAGAIRQWLEQHP